MQAIPKSVPEARCIGDVEPPLLLGNLWCADDAWLPPPDEGRKAPIGLRVSGGACCTHRSIVAGAVVRLVVGP
jgi:hypothetical protein